MKFLKYASLILISAFPLVSLAFFEDLTTALDSLVDVLNKLIIIAYAVAFLGLVWGVAIYIFKAGDEDAHEQGRRIMIGGVIGLFVITALWGIVAFVTTSVGIDATKTGTVPKITIQP